MFLFEYLPDNALVFQVLSREGPLWYEDGFPVEWSEDHYKRWTPRVSGPHISHSISIMREMAQRSRAMPTREF